MVADRRASGDPRSVIIPAEPSAVPPTGERAVNERGSAVKAAVKRRFFQPTTPPPLCHKVNNQQRVRFKHCLSIAPSVIFTSDPIILIPSHAVSRLCSARSSDRYHGRSSRCRHTALLSALAGLTICPPALLYDRDSTCKHLNDRH